MPRQHIFFILLAFLSALLSAQENNVEYDHPENGFELMRTLAGEGNYAKAKSIGIKILEEDPAYNDVAIYMARIYGWEAQYDSAYQILENVLSTDSSLFEAYQVMLDLAYWENDPVKLQEFADRALALEPDSALMIEGYLQLKKQAPAQKDFPELFVHYSYDHFGVPYVRNWHMTTFGGNFPVKNATLSPYLNAGYMAGVGSPSMDLQLNLDAYLTLGKKNYALAGYGISPRGTVDYLPGHRAVAELWQVLPAGFVLSAGLRYFYWEQHFTFMTVSLEKYAGNYWFSLRNYLFFKDYGVSGSYYLSGRRYFADKFNHLTLTLGYGTAPDEPLVVVSDLERLNALSGRLEFSKQIKPSVRLNTALGYAYEEFEDARYRNRVDVRIGLFFRLKQ